MKILIVSLLLILVVVGCSDSIRTEFATLADAKAARAFERGWLPPLLPEGATRIVEVNDLDADVGRGSFSFPSRSLVAYLRLLEESHGASIRKIPSGVEVRITHSSIHWTLLLDSQAGQATYRVTSRQ
ncbi:MAG: hypothetical protein WC708_20595 [Lentisphaeria bacterium]